MSTSSFGQPSPFGAPAPPPPAPVDEPSAAKGNKTVVIAVAAGVVALGVLGGAAALVLGTGSSDTVDTALPPAAVSTVEPSATPSAPSAPLPTAAVQGRNVFVPLVEDEAAVADDVVDPVAAAAATPTAAPTTAPTSAPVSLPVSIPLPAVTRTLEVPGPVVTESVPGPTVTSSTPGPTQTVDRFAYAVEVVSFDDVDGDPLTPDDNTAVFTVNGTDHQVTQGDLFLEVFRYEGYVPAVDETEASVLFTFASTLWSVSPGTRLGLGPR